MSKIFRSDNKFSDQVGMRKIGIRDLQPITETEPDIELTVTEVLEERSRLLEDAHEDIAAEKVLIENMRRTAAEDIASMQTAWQEEKIELGQQAYDEGFQIGFEEGREKVLSDMNSSIKVANETTIKSVENAAEYLASQEKVILDLAMKTAERIIGLTLEADEEVFLTIIRRALKETQEMKEIKLFVSMDYYKLVSENRAELASIFPPDVPFLVFVNEDFESTECYIETNHGRIVVSVDDQLNEIRKQLIEIMESGD